jgi:hypothetical protein
MPNEQSTPRRSRRTARRPAGPPGASSGSDATSEPHVSPEVIGSTAAAPSPIEAATVASEPIGVRPDGPDPGAPDPIVSVGPTSGRDPHDDPNRRRRKRSRRRTGAAGDPWERSSVKAEESTENALIVPKAAVDRVSALGADVTSGTGVNRSADLPARNPRGGRNSGGERGPQGLEGSRTTQVSATDAMRAREFGRPTAEDLAAAEQQVVLVRRNYVPPTPLQHSSRQQSSRQQSSRRQPSGRSGRHTEERDDT